VALLNSDLKTSRNASADLVRRDALIAYFDSPAAVSKQPATPHDLAKHASKTGVDYRKVFPILRRNDQRHQNIASG